MNQWFRTPGTTGLLDWSSERLFLRMWNARKLVPPYFQVCLKKLNNFRFPDIAFFRESDIQDQLTSILFLHSVTNPSIGYRQGMCTDLCT